MRLPGDRQRCAWGCQPCLVAGFVSASCSSPCLGAPPKDEVPAIGQTRAADGAVMVAHRFLRTGGAARRGPIKSRADCMEVASALRTNPLARVSRLKGVSGATAPSTSVSAPLGIEAAIRRGRHAAAPGQSARSRPNKDPPLPRPSGASFDVCGCWLSHEPEGRCVSLSFDSISDDNFAQINDDFP
jgi:hypothetical protein